MTGHQEQHEKEAEAIDAINKKTGRNMPQAIGTAVVLIAIILACLLISVDLFVYLVVLFMMLALWELRVDFATVGLHIPVVTLWVCSAATLLATYYSTHHIVAMTVCVLVSLLLVAIAASAKVTFGSRLSLAVADKLSHTDAGARLESSFNHEQGEVSHSRLSHVAVSMFTVLYIPLLASCLIMPLTFNNHPVAHAIMLLAQTPKDCTVFHPYNTHRQFMSDILTGFAEAGITLKRVEPEEFQRTLESVMENPGLVTLLRPLMAYDMGTRHKTRWIDSANDYTTQVLYRLGFQWPPTAADYVHRFVDTIMGFDYFTV